MTDTPDTPDAASAAAPDATLMPDAATALWDWFEAHVRNTPLAQDTAVYNRLFELVQQAEPLLLIARKDV